MSRLLLRLNGKEAACIYASVTSEIERLKDDIEGGALSSEEVAAARQSIELCRCILSKLSSDGAVYSVRN